MVSKETDESLGKTSFHQPESAAFWALGSRRLGVPRGRPRQREQLHGLDGGGLCGPATLAQKRRSGPMILAGGVFFGWKFRSWPKMGGGWGGLLAP